MSLMLPKPTRQQSRPYLAFVRNHTCVIAKRASSRSAGNGRKRITSFSRAKGETGSKVSDYQTLPFCQRHHEDYHQRGREAFSEKYGLDLAQLVIEMLTEYILTLRPEEG